MKSIYILLFFLFVLEMDAQVGDITRNPLKEFQLERIVFNQNMNEFLLSEDAIDSIVLATINEKTTWSIPVGTSTGTSKNGLDGGAQLGFQFGKLDKYHAKVGFNLAAIEKTVKGKAVNNLLINPATTSLSMYADGAYWFYNLFKSKVLLGPYGRFGLASSEFMITEEDLNPISGSLLHLSTGLSFISKPFRFDLGDEKDNVMQIGLEIGYGYRGIVGTIAFDKNIDRRNEILGFNNTSLGNFESTIHLRYNNIRPFARITGFNLSDRNGSKVEIDDLSGFQVFWGVDILTNIVSKSIN